MPQAADPIPPTSAPSEPGDRREAILDRRAAAQDDAKRTFLRMVSHELRTPLNAIIGFSEIIAGELYGPLGAPQYRQYAEHVRESGYKLLSLVNQVLEIARLQGQVIDLDVRAEPLDHALDDIRDQLRGDLTARNAVIAGEGALPTVLADPKGLRTLLLNLIQNAVRYGPEGGVVEVTARRRGDRVEIDVRDHGEGIDPADIPRLMNPFEQGDNALTRSTKGPGLGLPIAYLLAQAMGGKLRLARADGGGLRASVTLSAA